MQNKDPGINETEETIRRYKNIVYGTALTQLKNKHDADDVFQEVFLLYFTKKLYFESDEAKRAWLVRATVNKCRQFNFSIWNTRVEKTSEFDFVRSLDLAPGEERDVYRAVTELDEKYRMPVYLHYFLGMPVEEIGRALNIRSNTVSVRLNRAKKLLRKRLEGYIL